MDDEIRRREAERQGRAAYMKGLPRNPTWPSDFLAAYDRAQDEDERQPPSRVSGDDLTEGTLK
jgi:hypothetical protein